MGDKTKIQWTDASYNPIVGCRRTSPGCEKCYAERLSATRLSQNPKYKGLAVMKPTGPSWTGKTRFIPETLAQPVKWKRPRKIFVCDMADLFYEEVSNEHIAAVFGVMAAAPRHTFQILTKRAKRMREWFQWIRKLSDEGPWTDCHMHALNEEAKFNGDLSGPIHRLSEGAPGRPWPLPNVWLGVSAENQETADARIPELLATPAAIHYVSYEPALGPVNFDEYLTRSQSHLSDVLSWVICGGESGPGARPFDINWARTVIDECDNAGAAAFVKQLGANPYESTNTNDDRSLQLEDRKGGNMDEWPEHLRVRQFPKTGNP